QYAERFAGSAALCRVDPAQRDARLRAAGAQQLLDVPDTARSTDAIARPDRGPRMAALHAAGPLASGQAAQHREPGIKAIGPVPACVGIDDRRLVSGELGDLEILGAASLGVFRDVAPVEALAVCHQQDEAEGTMVEIGAEPRR